MKSSSPRRTRSARRPPLGPYLDAVARAYQSEEFLPTDPLSVPHGFSDPRDQEIAGFIASALAYGRVDGILRSAWDAIERMGGRPFEFVRDFEPRRDAGRFDGWVHRFNRGEDLAALCLAFRQVLEVHDSLGALFASGLRDEDLTVGPALVRFCDAVLALDFAPLYPGGQLPERAGLRWFFASPRDGSACKRLNLYLRWMSRRDSVDLGLWEAVSPRRLLMPVDTHVARICTYLGLTNRKTVGWRMVEEITAELRVLDPSDPVRYDWSICRLGILQQCPRKRQAALCSHCSLFPVCRAG